MQVVTEFAAPKINLTLRVLGRRNDGYHELESLVAFAAPPLADVITFEPGTPIEVTTTGRFAASIAGQNLVQRTLERLAAVEPRLRLGRVSLRKLLPVAAGIGGGSADAAAVLRAVRSANSGIFHDAGWYDLAAHLGADVPVCLESRSALMWGIGEKLTHLNDLPPLPVVLVNPLTAVPADKTAQVFRLLGARAVTAANAPPRVPGPFASRDDLIEYMAVCGNDLTLAARHVVPEIDALLQALRACDGCRLAQVSGGGPTCFGVFDSSGMCGLAERRLRSRQPNWWVESTVLAGAHH